MAKEREEAIAAPRSFEQFVQLMRDALNGQAARKGYSTAGEDGPNALYDFCVEIGAEPGHTVGECLYKLRELLKEPREVLPIKIAAWCFLIYRAMPKLRQQRELPAEK